MREGGGARDTYVHPSTTIQHDPAPKYTGPIAWIHAATIPFLLGNLFTPSLPMWSLEANTFFSETFRSPLNTPSAGAVLSIM